MYPTKQTNRSSIDSSSPDQSAIFMNNIPNLRARDLEVSYLRRSVHKNDLLNKERGVVRSNLFNRQKMKTSLETSNQDVVYQDFTLNLNNKIVTAYPSPLRPQVTDRFIPKCSGYIVEPLKPSLRGKTADKKIRFPRTRTAIKFKDTETTNVSDTRRPDS